MEDIGAPARIIIQAKSVPLVGFVKLAEAAESILPDAIVLNSDDPFCKHFGAMMAFVSPLDPIAPKKNTPQDFEVTYGH